MSNKTAVRIFNVVVTAIAVGAMIAAAVVKH